MPREEKITCDVCRKDLTYVDFVPRFRLCLTAEDISFVGNVIAAVLVYPPIEKPMYFCGLKCLWDWSDRIRNPPSTISPGRIAVTCSGRISDVKLENAS